MQLLPDFPFLDQTPILRVFIKKFDKSLCCAVLFRRRVQPATREERTSMSIPSGRCKNAI